VNAAGGHDTTGGGVKNIQHDAVPTPPATSRTVTVNVTLPPAPVGTLPAAINPPVDSDNAVFVQLHV